MSKLKFAVAGTGWVSGEYLKAISLHPDAEVYAIVSENEERAQAKLQEAGLDAKIFTQFEEADRKSVV